AIMTLAIYESALNWLGKGFHLLPIQPGSKKQVQGFGIHLSRITNARQAMEFFRDTYFNLAVIVPDDYFVIDFDDESIFYQFLKSTPESIHNTYTETTPNFGAHLFFRG